MIQLIKEKAVSKSQQRLMGLAYSVKKGETKLSDIEDEGLREKVKGIVDSMTEKELKEFAETSHTELDENATLDSTVGIGSDQSLPSQSGNTERELTDEEIKAMHSSQIYQQNGIKNFSEFYKDIKQKYEEDLKSENQKMIAEGKVKISDIVDSLIAFGYDPISIKKLVSLFNAQKEVSQEELIYNLSSMGLSGNEIETILN